MNNSSHVNEESFNLLCGNLIGNGSARTVFECRLNPSLVVKVETDDYRRFQNILEWNMWNDFQQVKSISKWLAPCHQISPDGRILLQSKCEPAPKSKLPKKLPSFLTDLKPSNFGLYKNKVVCFDYGLTIYDLSEKMKKIDWTIYNE